MEIEKQSCRGCLEEIADSKIALRNDLDKLQPNKFEFTFPRKAK